MSKKEEQNLLFLRNTIEKSRTRLRILIEQTEKILEAAEEEISNLYNAERRVQDLLIEISPTYIKLWACDFSVRTYNLLKNDGITDVSHLLSKTEEEIKKIPGIGKKSFSEIKDFIEEIKEKIEK